MAEDCNDTDAEVFPGATEVCNSKDDDCDGVIDSNSCYEKAGGKGSGGSSACGGCSGAGGSLPLSAVALLPIALVTVRRRRDGSARGR